MLRLPRRYRARAPGDIREWPQNQSLDKIISEKQEDNDRRRNKQDDQPGPRADAFQRPDSSQRQKERRDGQKGEVEQELAAKGVPDFQGSLRGTVPQ